MDEKKLIKTNVAMGLFDGEEIYELVCLFLHLDRLVNVVEKKRRPSPRRWAWASCVKK